MSAQNLNLFQQSHWFIKVLNILPKHVFTTYFDYYSSVAMRFVQVTVLITIILANVMHLLKRVSDAVEKIVILGPIMFNIMNLLKLLIIYYRSGTIMKCFDHMATDWKEIRSEEDRKIMMDSMQWGQRLTILFIIVMYIGAIGYVVIMPVTVHILTRNERNISMRVPVFPGYDVAFGAQHTPVYETVMVTYFYGAFLMYSIAIFSNHLAIQFVQHSRGQLKIIKKNLSISKECSLVAAISRHVRILRFAVVFKQALYEICLADVVFSTLMICLGEYSVLQVWRKRDIVSIVTYAVLTFALCLSPMTFCWLSEVMDAQFADITKIYLTRWYDRTDQKSIILILLAAQNSQKIDAGVMELSFNGFLKIVKTAVGYFQMLRTI